MSCHRRARSLYPLSASIVKSQKCLYSTSLIAEGAMTSKDHRLVWVDLEVSYSILIYTSRPYAKDAILKLDVTPNIRYICCRRHFVCQTWCVGVQGTSSRTVLLVTSCELWDSYTVTFYGGLGGAVAPPLQTFSVPPALIHNVINILILRIKSGVCYMKNTMKRQQVCIVSSSDQLCSTDLVAVEPISED